MYPGRHQPINVPPLVQTQMLTAVHRVPSWKGDQTPINTRISYFDLNPPPGIRVPAT